MNLPNKLTIFRVILIVPFVFFMELPQLYTLFGSVEYNTIVNYSSWIALVLFILASLTDLMDGYIARKYDLVTTFGKFMDPLADKLLVSAALILLVAKGSISATFVIIILSREFIISGFRLVGADKGIVIAASMWGKVKTVFQMVMIGMMIPDIEWKIYEVTTNVVMWIAILLTIISLIDYLVKNKEVMADVK